MQEQTWNTSNSSRNDAAPTQSAQNREKYPEYSDRCSPKEWANHVLQDLVERNTKEN